MLVLTLLLFMNACSAQSQYAKTVGGTNRDYGESAVKTTDGGYAMTGWTNSFGTVSVDLFLIKFNYLGFVEWSKLVGGTSGDIGYSIIQTNNGGFAVAGYTTSYGAGGADLFLVKFDSLGSVVWAKAIGGTLDDEGISVVQTFDGGFAVAGGTLNFGAGNWDLFLVKFTSSGSVDWAKSIGGPNWDWGWSIIQTSDSGYVIVGYTQSFGAGSYDLFIVKLTSTGSLDWVKAIGGTDLDYGRSIIQTSDDGYAVVGWTHSFGAGWNDLFLVKLNSEGSIDWTRAVGGTDMEGGSSIVQTTDDGYVVTGGTGSFGIGTSDLFLVKFNSSGAVEWSRAVGGEYDDMGHSVVQTTDGGYAVAGYTTSFDADSSDLFLVKFDSDGNTCIGEEVFPTIMDITPNIVSPSPTITDIYPTITDVIPTLIDVTPTTTEICTDMSGSLTIFTRWVNSCSWFSCWVRNNSPTEIAESTWVAITPLYGASCLLSISCDTLSYDCIADTASFVYSINISPDDSSYVTFFFCPNPACAEGDSICFRDEVFTSNPMLTGDVDTLCFELDDCDSCWIIDESCAFFHEPVPPDWIVVPCDSPVCFLWSECCWNAHCWEDTIFLFYDLYVDDSVIAESLYCCPEDICDSFISIPFDEIPLCPYYPEPGDTHIFYLIAYSDCDSFFSDTFHIVALPCCAPAITWVECPLPCWNFSSCADQTAMFGIIDTSGVGIDTMRVFFSEIILHIHGDTDTITLNEPSTELSFSGDIAELDSIVANITDIWMDGDSIVIMLDSVFSNDGCKIFPP